MQGFRWLSVWHLASLDAPTVAIVWASAIAWAAGVHLETWITLLLACGTWTVYVGDRLLDARRAIRSGNHAALRERHYFHWRHRLKLLPIAACTAAVAIILIVRLMPVAVRERDSLIAAAALAYFSGVHAQTKLPAWMTRIASKEFLVGVLFTAGCAAPALSRLHWNDASAWTEWPVLACILFFAVLAWLNCTAIKIWESSIRNTSFHWFAAIICIVGLAASLTLSFSNTPASGLICTGAVSAFLLFLLDHVRNRIEPLTLRALADVALLTPAILLALGVRQI